MNITAFLRTRWDRWRPGRPEFVSLRSSRLALHPNEFLEPDIVFYHADEAHPVCERYFLDHQARINRILSEQGMQFVFLPRSDKKSQAVRAEALAAFLAYRYPGAWQGDAVRLAEILPLLGREVASGTWQTQLATALGIPGGQGPALVHRIMKE